MANVYFAETIGPFHTGARVVNTFTTKQDVTPSPVPVILGGKLRGESKIYMRASGDISSTGSPTFNWGFWFGTRALSITGDVALSSAITVTTGVAWPWWMEWDGICTAPGVAGTLLGSGQLQVGSSLTTFNAEVPIPITAALRTVTIDTTIERAFGVSATCSASSASNQITVNAFRLNILN